MERLEKEMIEKLKDLKERIMKGTTSAADIDVVNEAIACIKELATLSSAATETPSYEDFIGMPNGINVTVENMTINIYEGKTDNPPHL